MTEWPEWSLLLPRLSVIVHVCSCFQASILLVVIVVVVAVIVVVTVVAE